jgi:hypothetical protein
LSNRLLVPKEKRFLLHPNRSKLFAPSLIIPGVMPIPVFLAASGVITPGSQTFDAASGNFPVPNYNVLTIELWGAGGAGLGFTTTSDITATDAVGTDGGASSVLSMVANGGKHGNSTQAGVSPGVGGTASGGNTTNTTGNTGGGFGVGTNPANGRGGGAANGGGDQNSTNNTTLHLVTPGTIGTIPGGGGSACVNGSAAGGTRMNGAGGGGYCKSVFTFGVTSGFPSFGALLAYVAGVGGVPAGAAPGGAGRFGRVKFTWS